MQHLDNLAYTQSWWRQIICGKEYENEVKSAWFDENYDPFEVKFQMDDDYEKYFIYMIAPYVIEKFTGESSGLRKVFQWYFRQSSFIPYDVIKEKFEKWVCINPNVMNSDRVEISDHLKFKYQISIDGITAAWQRVPWILLSGSVLLFVESNTEEWFYRDIHPWVHYVPVKNDLSDLFEKIDWLRANDKEAQEIAKRA